MLVLVELNFPCEGRFPSFVDMAKTWMDWCTGRMGVALTCEYFVAVSTAMECARSNADIKVFWDYVPVQFIYI